MEHYFNNKNCVVTGAASGIGLAVAKKLLEKGAYVTFSDIDEAGLQKATAELGNPEKACFVKADVAKLEDVEQLIKTAEKNGEVDILFNNAGICRAMSYPEVTEAQWRQIIDINLMGVVYGIQCVLPSMLKRGSGQIVNTSSISGLVPTPFESMYTATKFAVTGLTQALRYELCMTGVKFNCVCPSDVDTPIYEHSVYIHGKPVNAAGFDSLKKVPVDEAAEIILNGTANDDGIIIIGETGYSFLNMYRSENGDQRMKDWTLKRFEKLSALLQ